MDIILLEKVDNLGDIGDRVRVKPGFARNYLLPYGKAKLATPENIAEIEAHRAELERIAAGELATAQARATELEQLSLKITAKIGEEGKLFGSVGPVDIADACADAGVPVERSEIRLAEGPIRVAGEHPVDFHLHADVNVSLLLEIIGEE